MVSLPPRFPVSPSAVRNIRSASQRFLHCFSVTLAAQGWLRTERHSCPPRPPTVIAGRPVARCCSTTSRRWRKAPRRRVFWNRSASVRYPYNLRAYRDHLLTVHLVRSAHRFSRTSTAARSAAACAMSPRRPSWYWSSTQRVDHAAPTRRCDFSQLSLALSTPLHMFASGKPAQPHPARQLGAVDASQKITDYGQGCGLVLSHEQSSTNLDGSRWARHDRIGDPTKLPACTLSHELIVTASTDTVDDSYP